MNRAFKVFLIIPGWIVFGLSYLIPRDKNLVAMGVHTPSLFGNVKALLIQNVPEEIQKVFIGRTRLAVEQAREFGNTSYLKYSLLGLWTCLRAGNYLYSSYPSDVNFWVSGGAKYINVWHGTPIKKIERDITNGYYSLRNRYQWLYKIVAPALLVKPDVLLVASNYEKDCFRTAFQVKDCVFVESFPPRLNELRKSYKTSSCIRNILYLPTWRDDQSFSITEHIDMKSFNDLLIKNNLILNIKLHPADMSKMNVTPYSNIIKMDQSKDIYDLLPEIDLVISDYSSIIFDCIYLKKPFALFCPDIESYQIKNRAFYEKSSEIISSSNIKQLNTLYDIINFVKNIHINDFSLNAYFAPFQNKNITLHEIIRNIYLQ